LPHKFTKPERLKSRKLIQQLFGGKGNHITVFPIKAVWAYTDAAAPAAPVQFGVSVPARNFAKATARNLLKRRMREAYRLQKLLLYEALQTAPQPTGVALMFIYIGKQEMPYHLIFEKTRICLARIAAAIITGSQKKSPPAR